METTISVSGAKTEQMGMASSLTRTVQSIKDTGSMINNTERAMSRGLTEPITKAFTKTETNTASVISSGQMARSIRDTSRRICAMGRVNIPGLMVGFITVTGSITKWMEKVCTRGQTARDTKEATRMNSDTATVYLRGVTEEPMLVTGFRASSMVEEFTRKTALRDWLNGKTDKEQHGLMTRMKAQFKKVLKIG